MAESGEQAKTAGNHASPGAAHTAADLSPIPVRSGSRGCHTERDILRCCAWAAGRACGVPEGSALLWHVGHRSWRMPWRCGSW